MDPFALHSDAPAARGVLNPYVDSVETAVRRVTDSFIELESTCFFGRSGGQVGDTGWIGGNRIVASERNTESSVRHFYEGGRATDVLRVGDVVDARIDFDRRYRVMRLHTAQHLAELAVNALHGLGPAVVGGVSPDGAFVDIAAGPAAFACLELASLQRWIDEIVADNLPIERFWDGRPYWLIDGVGQLSCDGTHVARSGEIGGVTLAAEPVDHHRTRLSVVLDSLP